MKIKDIPVNERPRERLIKYGVDNLSNEDLLSIILQTGTKNLSVKELSLQILSKIKSLNELNNISLKELSSIKGIGKVKAINLIAAIELGKRVNSMEIEDKILLNNSELINKYFSHMICKSKQEELLVVLLNNAKKLIGYKRMFKGADTSTIISIKEILNYAIMERACGIVIMHNHPSGNPNPSSQDIVLTNNLIKSAELIGIPLLDHIVTCGNKFYSFLEEKVIYEK